ncbi:UNVERIFIED_CONTAM: hypothetical protein Slati_0424900 [Sesamum latifolium]|uniref:Retrotransposon gag domain-containing protein n=1 Tax=Sesamum latifolium TaxID=2727402 RepID=A0AAW2XV41_9LAMI
MTLNNQPRDNGSYEGNSSLPAAAGPTVPPTDPAAVATNIPAPALDQTDGPAVLNPLFCEQLRQFIMETINSILRGSQASGAGPSSQLERGGTPTSQGMDEQSLKKEIVELLQQVAKETLPTEHGILFSGHIMMEELPAHFRAPSHLLAYVGTTDPIQHIRKFENAVLLHSSLFQHQFASSKKYQKSIISLFGVKQEDNESLRAYVQCFNTTILEDPTAHQEVLVSAFTQGLYGDPLFESLTKKPAVDYLDVLTRAEKYMNLENTLLVRRGSRWRKNELSSSSRSKEQAEEL